MKRPKFFEDLDRSLSGEEELQDQVAPRSSEEEERARLMLDFFRRQTDFQARVAEMRYAHESAMRGLDQRTATGAMIDAQMQAQAAHPQLAYMARRQDEMRGGGYVFGSTWDALGLGRK